MAKILIIDDDEGIREAVTAILEVEGYNVVSEDCVDECISIAEETKPDLILMDLLLAGGTGDVITRDLKKNKQTAKVPVIMMSAHPTAAEQAKAAGADDFIAKPFDIDELLQKIKQHTS